MLPVPFESRCRHCTHDSRPAYPFLSLTGALCRETSCPSPDPWLCSCPQGERSFALPRTSGFRFALPRTAGFCFALSRTAGFIVVAVIAVFGGVVDIEVLQLHHHWLHRTSSHPPVSPPLSPKPPLSLSPPLAPPLAPFHCRRLRCWTCCCCRCHYRWLRWLSKFFHRWYHRWLHCRRLYWLVRYFVDTRCPVVGGPCTGSRDRLRRCRRPTVCLRFSSYTFSVHLVRAGPPHQGSVVRVRRAWGVVSFFHLDCE